MRTRSLILGLSLLLASLAAHAADNVTYESITVANSAIGITSTIHSPSGLPQQTTCQARLETAQIRYRFDGVDPTSSEGMLLEVGDVLTILSNADARRIRFIRTGSTSGTLKVSCWS